MILMHKIIHGLTGIDRSIFTFGDTFSTTGYIINVSSTLSAIILHRGNFFCVVEICGMPYHIRSYVGGTDIIIV